MSISVITALNYINMPLIAKWPDRGVGATFSVFAERDCHNL